MNLYWRLKRRDMLTDHRSKVIVLGDGHGINGEALLVREFILRLIRGIEEFKWVHSWENFYPIFFDGFLNIVKSYNYSDPVQGDREFYAFRNSELFSRLRRSGAPDLRDDLVLIPPPEFWTILCYDLSDVLFPDWARKKVGEGVSVDYLRNYKLARRVIALSKSVKRELIRFGVDHKRITVLPYDFGDPVRKTLTPWPRNYLLVPMYGEERDNIANVKRAIDSVRDRLRLNAIFLNMSMNKSAVPDMDGFRIVTPRSLREIEGWFSRARAVLYAPSYDGWGWPALAAIRHGKPLIAAGNSALLEIGPGYAEYVRDNEVEHIIHVLRRVWSDTYRVNQEVREEILRVHTTERSRGTLRTVIEETLERRRDE